MSGYRWVTHAGHDWQVLDVELEPDRVMLGLVLDYGRIDEGPSEIGTLALAAGALRAELQRPIEVGPGEVSVPDADVWAGPTSLTITLRGRRRAVLAAWDHLGALLAAPRLTGAPEPAPTPSVRWARNLATYIGLNAETVSATRLRGVRELGAAEALLARIAPDAGGVRHLFVTDDPYLVGVGWSGRPPARHAPARSARYLDLRPALVPCDDDTVVLASAVAPDENGSAAINAVALRLVEILAELRIAGGLVASTTYLRDTTVVVYTLDTEITGSARRRILDQLLRAGLPLPDTIVEQAVERIDPGEVAILYRLRRLRETDAAVSGQPGARRADAGAAPGVARGGRTASTTDDLDAELAALLTSGSEPPAPAPHAPTPPVAAPGSAGGSAAGPASRPSPEPADLCDPRPTAAGTRRCVDQLLASVHAVLEDETADLAGSGAFLAWSQPPVPQGLVEAFQGFDPAGPWRLPRPHRVCAGDEVFMSQWLRWRDVGQGRWQAGEVGTSLWIDLSDLALAMRDDDTVYLVDGRMRHVGLSWSELAEHPRLRALLEAHGLPTIPWYHVD